MIEWLENHQQACFYKSTFGIECPGCGMQRAFIELLKGNIYQSFVLFPALIPILVMFGFLILHIIFKFKNGARILLYMFIGNTSIIVISYLIKIINLK